MQRPLIVAFEGIDCCGKSTHAKNLEDVLKARGFVVTRMVFPDHETLSGGIVRLHLASWWKCRTADHMVKPSRYIIDDDAIDPTVFQCMQSSNRLERIPDCLWPNPRGQYARAQIGEPTLRRMVFLFDRFHASAYAYGRSDGLDLDWLLSLHRNMPQPDLTMLVDISPEESAQRLSGRREPPDRYEKESMKRVYECYHEVFGVVSKDTFAGDWRIVDGLGNKAEVFNRVLSVVEDVLPLLKGS